MRASFAVLLSSFVACSCSQKQPTSADLAALLLPAGRFIECPDGYVLYVEKRSGTALQNITVYRTTPDGGKTTIKAKAGTISPGSDSHSIKVTLHNAEAQIGKSRATIAELVIEVPYRLVIQPPK